MRSDLVIFRLVLASAFCLASTFVHADVMKCIDTAGAITYTDKGCGEDLVSVRLVPEKETFNRPVKPIRPATPKKRIEATAYRGLAPDVASIRSARTTLELMDMERRLQQLRVAASN